MTSRIELSGAGKRYTKYEDTPMLLTRALRVGPRPRRSMLWLSAALLVVVVLSIPRARTVSPRLVSRGRIGWVLIFGVITAYAVATTVSFGPPGAPPQLLLSWLGDAIVILGIALPHRPD